MRSMKWWVLGYLILTLAGLVAIGSAVFDADPFFHFHSPDPSRYFYRLSNQRSQNNGILRHFAYDGIIAGTSMVENTRTSEAESLFGGSFVKVCSEGATFREISGSLSVALRSHPSLKKIIWGLDMDMLFDEPNRMRTDLGTYPTYLYDENPLNDVEYLLNRDILFSWVLPMKLEEKEEGFVPGMTSFDDYSSWMKDGYPFGRKAVFAYGTPNLPTEQASEILLTRAESERILANIRQNVTDLAKEYPQVTFYLFFTPYSALWWQAWSGNGELTKKVDAERIVIEEILTCENIRLFSFNCIFDLTTDLNNYKDMNHYGDWVNSMILRFMARGNCHLTTENYEDYLMKELDFYQAYDYAKLLSQTDDENDELAATRMLTW